jgi:pyocin large subunit-like protein
MKNSRPAIPWLVILAAVFSAAMPVPAAFAQSPIQFRVHEKIGFKSERLFREHFRKHGKEFGKVNQREYLLMAQQLRDRPLDMNILESVRRKDGVITRFDRKTGAFIAFERNLVIRTFFKPADGERYFVRQTKRGSRRR